MTKNRQHIVVGVSGSLASRAALSWAAEEARLRKAKLHVVVRAWDPARHAAPYAAVGATPTAEEQQAAGREDLAAAMRAEFGPDMPDGVTAELAEGVAERVLVDRSADADLLGNNGDRAMRVVTGPRARPRPSSDGLSPRRSSCPGRPDRRGPTPRPARDRAEHAQRRR